jgi:putative ABC transport system ATP-binding protein
MLEVKDLSKIYTMGSVQVHALSNISISISSGDLVCVIGKSGSGKSTLLRQLGLLDRPTSGEIMIDDKKVTAMSERTRADLRLRTLGYVFQEYALLGELTAIENVYLPGMMLGKPGNHFKKRAVELLNVVGLKERLGHLPKELSGGEQQRVAIARALINEPKILFADEPCANLDSISSKIVMETLVKLNNDMKVTIIFVSHDPDDKKYAKRVIQLRDGRIGEGGTLS